MRALRFVWGLYCFIVLAIVVFYTSITIWVTSAIFGWKAKKFNLYFAQKLGCNLITLFSLIFKKVEGREWFEKDRGYVIIGNHSSNYDIFINSTTFPLSHVFCFLSKSEIGDIPFFGIIAKNLAVLVDRSSMTSRVKSFKKMKETLNEGISVWIFAEGTRNKSDEPLLPFKDGAFSLAVDMKVPIIVNTLVGVKKVNNPNYKIDMWPGMVTSYFEEPIDTSNMTKEDIPALKEKVRNLMLARLEYDE